jgi:hypothetical protein
MNDDLVDKMFADMDEYYPGSKRKRRQSIAPEPVIRQTDGWDATSYKKVLNGEEVEMFTIGALAAALGRPIITIRQWIREGHIPQSPYRLPTKKDKHGVEHKGRRLYTRSMIETAIDVFTRNGLMTVKRIEWGEHQTVHSELDEAWWNSSSETTN